MKPAFKQKLKEEFIKYTNREPKQHEEINIENDYLLMQRALLREIEELQDEMKKIKIKIKL